MPGRGGRWAEIDSIADLLDNDGFRDGVLYAAGGVVVVALVALLVGGGPRRNPWAGLVFAGAALAGLDHQSMLPDDLLTGLGVLAIGGLLGELFGRAAFSQLWGLLISAGAMLPGATLVANSAEIEDPGWVTPTLLVVIAVGAALAADFDRTIGTGKGGLSGLPPVLLAVTMGGVWATVPETQHAVVLVGAAVPVVLLGWPRPLASLGGTGAALTVGTIAWVTAVDGVARPGAVVGGFACLGLFVLEPLLRRIGAADVVVPDGGVRPLVVLVGAHLVLVGLSSRVAGLSTSAVEALAFVALAYIVVAVALVANRFRTGSPRS